MKICKVVKEGTNKEYTYLTDLDLAFDDRVVAEFGKADTVLTVNYVGEMTQEEYDALGFPLKSIKRLATDEDLESQTPALDVVIKEERLPIININFDEIKTNLSVSMAKYKGLIVTEETLSGCKATQKDLAGLKRKIDTYRKDKKKELSRPIAAFEEQCKELISLIEQVENPIKEGISVFDDEKRAEKRRQAEEYIKEIAEESGLADKYAVRLTVIDKYCNLTAKKLDIIDDIKGRAFALKIEQDRETELMGIIQDTINAENERLARKMSLAEFQRLISGGAPAKDIIAEIRARASVIYEAEHPIVEEPIEEPAEEVIEEPVEEVTKETIEEAPTVEPEKVYSVEYKITANLSTLREVSEFLRLNYIPYEAIDQREV
ncbi:MAG: DUF1351 domain-containing protein [Eubacteriales bacterium]|nr:DUF1351 domain-containing protein [Eubacteriales bacterium]